MRLSSVARRTLAGVLVTAVLGAGLTLSAPAAFAAPPVAPAGLLTTITPGLTGYDSLGVNTQTQTNCLSTSSGYSFAMVNTNGMANLDGTVITTSPAYQQYNAAAATGMKIALFQGYGTAATFWTATNNGNTRGIAAAVAAKAVRYPANAMIFLNLEATTKATHAQVLTFVKQWIAAVKIRKYLPGIYVGANSGLTAADLNALVGVAGYWKSPSTSGVPTPARGYVLQQPFSAFEKPLCGVKSVDGDVAGTDGKGAKLIGAAFPKSVSKPSAAGGFVPLSPTRVLDTRSGLGGHKIVASTGVVNLQLTGGGKVIPTGASAVVMNLTVTSPTRDGYVSIYPSDKGRTSSTLNFVPNQTVANLATVQLSAGGAVSLYNGSAGTVQLLADVAGYYVGTGTPSVNGTFVPITPARLLDTRPTGVAARSKTALLLAGRDGLPAASAFSSVVLNATAVAPAASGFLTVFPAGTTQPEASNLNFTPGRNVPNMVTAMTSASGLTIYNGSADRMNLLADVAGYYRAGSPAVSGSLTGTFDPLTPARLLDTRAGNRVPASSAISLRVAGRGGLPATGASAVVLNITAANQAKPGYLSVFPSDRSAPNASNINFGSAQTIANQVIVPIGADGRVVLLNQSAGTTDLIADVAGYFKS